MSAPAVVRIAGYAALFDLADAANDVIRKGAFARTLAQRTNPIPLYWQHRAEQRIGFVELSEEDDRGLRVIARIDTPTSRAVSALRAKSVSGLSFGYKARRCRRVAEGRVLEDIDLFEISVVTYPLQHGARLHLVR